MIPEATAPVIEDDIRFYPNHEEDDVPEGPLHLRWSGYLVFALGARFPERFVSGNNCIYWEPRNYVDYVAPDAYVVAERVPEPPPRVYRTWLLPALLFAAEIGSKHNTREKIKAKRARYAEFVRPKELLETDPVDEEAGEVLTLEQLHLYRLTDEGYAEVEREPNGRFRSTMLELEIGVDEANNLRLYTLSGERVLTHEEEMRRRLEAEARAEQEARGRVTAEERAAQEARERAAAEQRAEQEARARAASEQRAVQEARERAAAEERARAAEDQSREEARARAAAEQRAAEEKAQREAVERELATLRARLARGDA